MPPTNYTSSVEAVFCPPSGEEDTLPSTHSNSVETVPAFPAGEADTLPTTLNSCNEQLLLNKNGIQQHVVRSTAVTASVVEVVPGPPSGW